MNRKSREPLGELIAAVDTLRTENALVLAVEAISGASERGFAMAYLRRANGAIGNMAAMLDREPLPIRGPHRPRVQQSWIVDIDAVPAWQQQCWVEPMEAGIHGPDYFARPHPVATEFGWRAPEYGRLMACRRGRLVAYAALIIDGRPPFRCTERSRLREVASRIAPPLRLAALYADENMPAALGPRQQQIVACIARGWSNKRIAREFDISPATVKTLLARLYRVAHVPNRTALLEWWHSGTR